MADVLMILRFFLTSGIRNKLLPDRRIYDLVFCSLISNGLNIEKQIFVLNVFIHKQLICGWVVRSGSDWDTSKEIPFHS